MGKNKRRANMETTPASQPKKKIKEALKDTIKTPTKTVAATTTMKKRKEEDRLSSDEEEETAEVLEEDETVADDVEGPQEVGGFTILGDFKAKEKKKVERVLPCWLKFPQVIEKAGKETFSSIKALDLRLVEKLKKNNILTCFPVQWRVLPELLAQSSLGVYAGDAGFRPRDVCVSAPTGSGKTLTFVLPIIQALQHRVVPHVRALVILPVRDLAIQVYNVFKLYSEDTGLKVALVAGKKEFQAEQTKLVRERPNSAETSRYASMADIVVATKGRLLDHIQRTPGFDLTHLRYLVIDEADRQMDDVYDDWLGQVETAAYTPKPGAYKPYLRPRPAPLTLANSMPIVMHVQKLLFSATLSQNPEKLEQMNLFRPLLFTTQSLRSKPLSDQEPALPTTEGETNDTDKFSTPSTLKELCLDCKVSEKPLVLFHFLLNEGWKQVVCFTNSVDNTHRLFLLAKQMPGIRVAEISSQLHTNKRERIIRQFARGDLHLLVCTDMMTRGMDIENVEYVISYDAPLHIETYIHRVGRTARANKTGTALTILEGKEMFHFKRMLRESARWDKLKKISVSSQKLEPLVDQYTAALKILPDIIKKQRLQMKQS